MELSLIYPLLNYSMLAVCVVIFISGIDDAFIDIVYWGRRLYRNRYVLPKLYKPINVQDLRSKSQSPIAIMVPAWDESSVIATMLSTTIEFYDYDHYYIFVGVYQNDVQTTNEVKRMANKFSKIQTVIVPHDGPTCKADCLNWIIQAVFLFETQKQIQFAGIVMHDSEDVVHPLELRLYNWLLDKAGLIQIPVRTLEREWYEFVSGTYLDEFAEWHCKDLVVREGLGRIVPSAGVATCFSREAMDYLTKENTNQPFNTSSLTEDYDISFRLSGVGLKQIFVNFPVDFEVTQRNFKGDLIKVTKKIPIAVSEFFPDRFSAAVRQKSRWIIGISLQGWSSLAWNGSWARKYFFLRDRKGLIIHFVTLAAYVLALAFMVVGFGSTHLSWEPFPYAFPVFLLWFNTGLLLNRLLQRMYFVAYLYSWRQALLVLPRVVVCNFINFFATLRALRRYSAAMASGHALTWEKTDHLFPSADQLAKTRKLLGELLQEHLDIDSDLMEKALQLNRITGRSLGKILVEGGCIDEKYVTAAICQQTGYPQANMETEEITLPPDFFPATLTTNHRVFPLRIDHLDKIRLAVTGPLLPATQSDIKKISDKALFPVVVSDSEMDRLLARQGILPASPIELVEEKLCAIKFSEKKSEN